MEKNKIFYFIKSMMICLLVLFGIACQSNEGYFKTVNDSTDSYIINIDAKTTTKEEPVSINLIPGRYSIKVINKSEGGEYIAWKAWFYKPKKNREGIYKMGWLNDYYFSSPEFPEVICTDGIRYKTPESAFSKAKNSSFYLDSQSDVNFYIQDSPRVDNSGGISLLLQKVSD